MEGPLRSKTLRYGSEGRLVVEPAPWMEKVVAQESLLFSPTVRSQAIQLTSQKQDFPICQMKTIILFAYFKTVVRIKWKCEVWFVKC